MYTERKFMGASPDHMSTPHQVHNKLNGEEGSEAQMHVPVAIAPSAFSLGCHDEEVRSKGFIVHYYRMSFFDEN